MARTTIVFLAATGIVLVFTIYLIVRIRIFRNDIKRQKKFIDDTESFY